LAHLEAENLRPIGDASRATLIRRASFDLRGLPPSQTEVEAFLRDPSPDDAAFAKVVDTFLQSERFGERWARHWLDVVRYADSVGRVWNAPFLYASRYRYWVIGSFNEDKPYNRFVAEQIDFVRRTFLGLTLACARCHDHKTEPVTLRDYYASAGIFDSSRTLSSTPNRNDGVVGGYVSPEVLVDLPTVALHIGTETFVRPSMDAWIVYGLGSEAEDLVGFVTINPVADNGGAMNYGSAFLPASFQRTRLSTTGGGVPDLSNGRLSDAQQRKQIEFIQKANRRLLAGDRGNPELEGIIQCYELAYKMQTSVPDVLDLDKEPQHIHDM
jgi:hypothetical protein